MQRRTRRSLLHGALCLWSLYLQPLVDVFARPDFFIGLAAAFFVDLFPIELGIPLGMPLE